MGRVAGEAKASVPLDGTIARDCQVAKIADKFSDCFEVGRYRVCNRERGHWQWTDGGGVLCGTDAFDQVHHDRRRTYYLRPVKRVDSDVDVITDKDAWVKAINASIAGLSQPFASAFRQRK